MDTYSEIVTAILLFSLIFNAALLGGLDEAQYSEQGDLVRQCEADLPRNQHCEIKLGVVVIKPNSVIEDKDDK